MKNYRKHVDDFFKEKLGMYRETPPADVWDDLDTRLDTLLPQATGTAGSYRWLRHVAIISLILFFGASVFKKMSAGSETPNVALNDATTKTGATQDGAANNNTMATANNTHTATANPGNNGQQTNTTIAAPAINTASTGNTPQANRKHLSSKATSKVSGKNQQVAGAQASANVENTYNATAGNTAGNELVFDNGKGGPLANNETQVQPPANKNKKEADNKQAAVKTNVTKKTTPAFHRLEAGMKLGYEVGDNINAAMKLIASPYIQYNLSSKWAIMVQPTIKFAAILPKNIGSAQSYYRENADSTVKQTTTPQIIGGTTQYKTVYTYSQSHDSIAKSYAYKGTYVEYELPVVLKYNITSKLAVYGGVNMDYSKLTGVSENTYTKSDIKRTIQVSAVTGEAPTTAAPVNTVIKYTGAPITDYNGSSYSTPQGSMLRVGYMVGFSYEYSQRWLLDALMQQTPASPQVQAGYNINSPLSATYFRLSVGYKFVK